MGRDVPAINISQADRRAYREKVRQCLDVFARMLADARFEAEPQQVGLEIELNLVDEAGRPSMKNTEVLGKLADPSLGDRARASSTWRSICPRGSWPAMRSASWKARSGRASTGPTRGPGRRAAGW